MLIKFSSSHKVANRSETWALFFNLPKRDATVLHLPNNLPQLHKVLILEQSCYLYIYLATGQCQWRRSCLYCWLWPYYPFSSIFSIVDGTCLMGKKTHYFLVSQTKKCRAIGFGKSNWIYFHLCHEKCKV